jgi:hypothetical protein
MPTPCGQRRLTSSWTAAVRALILWVACSATAWFSNGVLAEDSPAELRREVAQRVSELSSPLRSERTRAEQALLELGPRILELLPAPEDTTDQATRLAVRQLRVKLERVAAEQSVLPSRVTFQGKATVAEIAAQIAAQTGNRLDVTSLNATAQNREIEVDFHDAPFWECVDGFSATAQVDWQPASDQSGLQFTSTIAKSHSTPVSYAGAFRVKLDSLTQQRETIRASLRLLAEPRLRTLFVRIVDADFAAQTGDKSLSLFSPRAVTELPMISRDAASFAVLFRANETAEPLTIRGRANVHVAAAPAEVRFDDLSGKRVAYLRRGGVSVTLKRSQLSSDTSGQRVLNARLAIAYDTGGPEFESHRTWIYHNDVRLESPDGTTYAPDGGFDVTQQSNGGVEVDYRFSGLPDRALRDWQLVYVAPTLLIDVPVEFAFENVPVSETQPTP